TPWARPRPQTRAGRDQASSPPCRVRTNADRIVGPRPSRPRSERPRFGHCWSRPPRSTRNVTIGPCLTAGLGPTGPAKQCPSPLSHGPRRGRGWRGRSLRFEVHAMDAVIVYESLWGNTAAVARAIAEGFGPGARVLTTDHATPAAVHHAHEL